MAIRPELKLICRMMHQRFLALENAKSFGSDATPLQALSNLLEKMEQAKSEEQFSVLLSSMDAMALKNPFIDQEILYVTNKITSTTASQIIVEAANDLETKIKRSARVHIVENESPPEYIQNLINRFITVIDIYLGSIEISSGTIDMEVKKKVSQISSLLNPDKKNIKSLSNKKLNALYSLKNELELFLDDGVVLSSKDGHEQEWEKVDFKESREAVLSKVLGMLNRMPLQFGLKRDGGKFFNTIDLLTAMVAEEMESEIFKDAPEETAEEIEQQLIEQLQAEKKTVMRMEPANIFKGNVAKNFAKSMMQESGSFGGEDQMLVVTSVKHIINEESARKYDDKKTEMKNKGTNRLDMSVSSLDLQQECLDEDANEAILLHGTSALGGISVAKEGFRKTDKKSYLSYVSSLGSGTYFTDSFSKGGSFSGCPLCGSLNCSCKIDDQNTERSLIISKVALGNANVVTKKRTAAKKESDSVIGLGKAKDPSSGFRSTEVCIADPSQVLPMFVVKYFTYTNMLLLNKWPQDEEFSGLREAITNLVECRDSIIDSPSKEQLTELGDKYIDVKAQALLLLEKPDITAHPKALLLSLMEQLSIELLRLQKTQLQMQGGLAFSSKIREDEPDNLAPHR